MLRLKGINKSFGNICVARDFDLHVPKGQALGVLGPNGAGKSSLLNLITGIVKPDSGEILLEDKNLQQYSIANRAKKGISRAFQIPKPFGDMSVFENLLVSANYAGGMQDTEAYRYCENILYEVGLIHSANILAKNLTLLDRKKLEMARALSAKPKLLLLDEIAGGLTEHDCHSLIPTILDIKSQGVTIIWIEHVINVLLATVDRVVVVNGGDVIVDDVPEKILDNTKVQEIYLGIAI